MDTGKRSLLLLAVLTIVMSVAVPAFAAPVPVGDIAVWSVNGHAYKLVQPAAQISWTDAEAGAASQPSIMGQEGYLATITSQAEQDFIEKRMLADGSWWLGGTDEETEGVWKWVTGEGWGYTNWYTGEPNNALDEDYLMIWGQAGERYGFWNDEDTPVTGYLVEWDVPEPSTLSLLGLGGLAVLKRKRKPA